MFKGLLHIALIVSICKLSIAGASVAESTSAPEIKDFPAPFADISVATRLKRYYYSEPNPRTYKNARDGVVEIDEKIEGAGVKARAEVHEATLKIESSAEVLPIGNVNYAATARSEAARSDFIIFYGGEGEGHATLQTQLQGELRTGDFLYNHSEYGFRVWMGDEEAAWSGTYILGYSSRDVHLYFDANQHSSFHELYEGDFDFEYGVPYAIHSSIHSNALHGASIEMTLGPVSFILPAGTTMVTASGYNYRVAVVPEPTTYVMLLAGLGLIGFVAKRSYKDF